MRNARDLTTENRPEAQRDRSEIVAVLAEAGLMQGLIWHLGRWIDEQESQT